MNQQTTDASAIFAPLWKHKWLILIVGVLVGGLSYLYYRHEARTFSSSTQVYLGSGSEEQGLFSNNQAKSTLGDRTVTDQVSLINSAAIGQLVHNKLRAEHDHAALVGTAHAKATSGSDFISITAEAHSAKGAETLASTYAQVYIKRQREDYQHNIRTGLSVARKQLRRIEAAQAASVAQAAKTSAAKGKGKGAVTGKSAAGSSGALQESNIASRINQLESDLGVAGVEQISPTKAKATLTSSSPKRNAIFGFVLGIVLACVAAFTLSRLDRRLQSIAAIERIFNTQVLAALPHVRQPVVSADGLSRPANPLLEPLRRLHSTLQLSSMLDHGAGASPRLILFLSADAGDGKSTVAADLALVQADAGERVAVVEADFRRPVLGKLLNVDGADGLAEVLAGKRSVGEALQIARSASSLAGSDHNATGGGVGTLVESPSIGSLSVLVGSTTVANPPALLARETTAELLRGLVDDHDRVLIDAPGLLEVSDAMPLLRLVDGIVIVARLGHTRELSAQRLVELLNRNSSASVLGVVVNDTPRSALASYGFAAEPGGRHLLSGILRR
jgi:Mrp family chromosome partitioning ATPase/capsular polysaccharide biosynthesis protein